jgi:hypothetical protein
MNRTTRSALEAFERVQEFLTQHPLADIPADLGEQATELADVVSQLSGRALAEETSRRFVKVHAKSEQNLLETLRVAHMRLISRVAREVFGPTGMDRAFMMPKDRTVTTAVLLGAAAMADAAEKQKETFVRHGLAPSFIDDLRGAAKALEEARLLKTENARKRNTATAASRDEVSRGRKAVRLLDAILTAKLAKEPELLAAWVKAKRPRPTTAPGNAPEVTALKVA